MFPRSRCFVFLFGPLCFQCNQCYREAQLFQPEHRPEQKGVRFVSSGAFIFMWQAEPATPCCRLWQAEPVNAVTVCLTHSVQSLPHKPPRRQTAKQWVGLHGAHLRHLWGDVLGDIIHVHSLSLGNRLDQPVPTIHLICRASGGGGARAAGGAGGASGASRASGANEVGSTSGANRASGASIAC